MNESASNTVASDADHPASRAFSVAVDGPAGSGKSSVSVAVAERMNFGYQDTGAAYRAFAWWAEGEGVRPEDETTLEEALERFDYRVSTDPHDRSVIVDGVDLRHEIRTSRGAELASRFAASPVVRRVLTARFRSIIREFDGPGIVTEGRDITTAVAPWSQLRLLVTAREDVRLARRLAQTHDSSADKLREALASRDARDSKSSTFFEAAPGVTVIDTSELTFESVVSTIIRMIEDANH